MSVQFPEPGGRLRAWGWGLLPLLLAAALGSALLGSFLFGKKVLLYFDIGADTYFSYYAFYHLLTQYLTDLSLPFWSFRLGAGTSIVSLYQFLFDPFSLIYYAAGVQHIATLVAWTFLLKAVLGAGFAYAYVRYLRVSPQVAVLAALLWAFNGFLMLWGQHFFFGSWVVVLPLLFLGVERFWREGRWLLLVLVAAYLALNIAIFFQVTVFFVLYLLARCTWDAPRLGARRCMTNVAGAMALLALGMGLSAVLWLPEYYLLSSSPRIASDPMTRLLTILRSVMTLGDPAYYWSAASRVFSNNLQGTGPTYKGFLNYYESLQLYAGLLPLLVLPQCWTVLKARERWLTLTGIGLALAAIASPAFAFLMNGMQYPSYRWGYGVIFGEIALSAYLLHRMLQTRAIQMPLLAATTVALAAAVVSLTVVQEPPAPNPLPLVGLLVAHAVLLVLWVRMQRRWIAFLALVAVLCVELMVEHYPTFMQRGAMNKDFERNGESHFSTMAAALCSN